MERKDSHRFINSRFSKRKGNEIVTANIKLGINKVSNPWWKQTSAPSKKQKALRIADIRKAWEDMARNIRITPNFIKISEERYMAIFNDIKRRFIIQHLRRASYKWPPRNEAKKKAKVSRGYYRCAICKEVFHYKQMQLDHIIPIIPVTTGWISYNDFIKRLFCESLGFQYLCKPDHKEKTKKENQIRYENKKK